MTRNLVRQNTIVDILEKRAKSLLNDNLELEALTPKYNELIEQNSRKEGFRIFPEFDIRKVFCGSFHSFIVTNDEKVYSFGSNLHGQLGVGNFNDQKEPTKVFLPTKFPIGKVNTIICGHEFSFFLSNKSVLYSCGENTNYQLGLGKNAEDQCYMQKVDTKNKHVKFVACGDFHTLIVTQDDTIYGCGCNSSGQMGLSLNILSHPLIPIRYSQFRKSGSNKNEKVRDIACGAFHSVILFQNNNLFMFGKNDDSQSGLKKVTQNVPTLITGRFSESRITHISAGWSHTMIVTNNSTIYGCGLNNHGQLCCKSRRKKSNLVEIKELNRLNLNVTNLYCKDNNTVVICDNADVFCFGESFGNFDFKHIFSGDLNAGTNMNDGNVVNNLSESLNVMKSELEDGSLNETQKSNISVGSPGKYMRKRIEKEREKTVVSAGLNFNSLFTVWKRKKKSKEK